MVLGIRAQVFSLIWKVQRERERQRDRERDRERERPLVSDTIEKIAPQKYASATVLDYFYHCAVLEVNQVRLVVTKSSRVISLYSPESLGIS